MPEYQGTANRAAITIRLGGLEDADVRVVELTGRECLNELFEYRVQLSVAYDAIDLDAVLKTPCTIEIAAGGSIRYIHGIVRGFERIGESAHHAYYAARVVPLHWMLSKRYGSRIFQQHNCQDMTVAGIIRKVLLDAGVPEDMFRFVLSRELTVREYVVQYRETEFDFVARLMEDEGLAFFFEHNDSRHVLVIGDAPTVFRPNWLYERVTYHESSGLDNAVEYIFGVRERRSIEYGATSLTDYNFKRPAMDMRTRYPGGPPPQVPPPAYPTPPSLPQPPTYGGYSPNGESPDYRYGGAKEYQERVYERSTPGPEAPAYGDESGSGYAPNAMQGPYNAGGAYPSQPGTPPGNGYGSNPRPPGYNGNGGGNGYGNGNGSGYSPPPAPPTYGGNGSGGYGGGSSSYGGNSYGGSSYGEQGSRNGGRVYERDGEGYQPSTEGYESDYGGSSEGHCYPSRPRTYNYPPRPPYAPPPYVPDRPPPRPPMEYGCSEVWVDYPGGYVERDYGQNRTQIRLEEYQCAVRVFEISANLRGLMAGYTFRLDYHPVTALNAEYLVTELVIRATQLQSSAEEAHCERGFSFEVQVRAIPANSPYRPPRKTPRPYVHGAQTAIVVGPSDEEIYVDEHGRVKVQFHWDREGAYDEYSSCWIRVSHGSAGGGYGMCFLPRVGHEVIVDFLEGNPDRPIITGRVYNGDHMPPYKLPEWKTRSVIKTQSTKSGYGTNEIRFEDKDGYEQILIYAQKDYHQRCNANRVETVGGNCHLTVKYDRRERTEWNHDNEVCLDLTEKVGGNKMLNVLGAVTEQFNGNHSEKCGSYYLKAQKGGVVIESPTEITFKVGGNFIKIDAAGVHVVGTLINLNSGGVPGVGRWGYAAAPRKPWEADSAKPGCQMRYRTSYDQGPPYKGKGYAPGKTEYETEPPPPSWIEIEMVDEYGQPRRGEEFELVTPEGDVINGTLDANGQAHVAVKTDGECQIRFPKLDQAAWERS